jgi:hypothetical protein
MPKRKYAYTQKNILEAWAMQYPSVRTWLAKLNNAKPCRALKLYYFCDWAKLDPELLLTLKEEPRNLAAELLLDKFIAESPYPECTKRNVSISVRSFFRCNYRELQHEAGKIDYVPQKPYRKPDHEKLLRLYRDGCYNQRDRALLCVTSCSAMALETLSLLLWSHFEENWQAQEIPHISLPPECIKGHGKGKYKGVRQETFITPETKAELIKYRNWMTKKYGKIWTPDMHVFLSIETPYTPLTYHGINRTVKNISERAGIPFSVHDGRRIVQTALENINITRNFIQKIKGRKVRAEDAPYSKPAIEQLRAKYREALPELEFLSQPQAPPVNPREKFLKAFAEVLERHPDKFEKFERFILNL